ncbi:MAG TPA: DUF349 domain-containing protein, partial [Vicinamibacteria bacterium]|nr:DUF349 domain-containing protein [Vicinamibacteria bacterium]
LAERWPEEARMVEPEASPPAAEEPATEPPPAAAASGEEGAAAAPEAPAEPARPPRDARVVERVALAQQMESLAGEDAAARIDELQARWEALEPLEPPDGESLRRRFEAAVDGARERNSAWRSAQERHQRIEALCVELEAIADLPDVADMDRRWAQLRKGWTGLQSMEGVPEELQSRYARAVARLETRHEEARQEREKQEVANVATLTALAERAEAVASDPEASLRQASETMRAVKEAMGHLGPLPRKDRDALLLRVKEARAKLYTRLTELRAADDWKRWANVAVQEELARRVEALKEEKDLRKAAKELADVEARWKDVRQAPRDQGEALWLRYKAARDEVRKAVRAHFAGEAKKRKENLARKEAMAAEAEALAESTEWGKTAERLRALQAEWKTVGPVPRDKAEAVWQRFRAAAGRFFARQKEDRSKRNAEHAKHLQEKEALIAKAEALADSTDWEATAAELRRLQAEWKKTGPVRRDKSEQVWQRFRAACDRFFDRYKHRGQIEAEAKTREREAVVEKVEALAREAGPETADIAPRLRAIQGEWRAMGSHAEGSLQERFAAAVATVVAAAPEAFKGTDLDADTNRKKLESLCESVEALAAPEPVAASPATLLAQRWREALAENTMRGRSDDKGRGRDVKQKVEAARAAWARVGPVSGEAGRQLHERFQRACRRALAQA